MTHTYSDDRPSLADLTEHYTVIGYFDHLDMPAVAAVATRFTPAAPLDGNAWALDVEALNPAQAADIAIALCDTLTAEEFHAAQIRPATGERTATIDDPWGTAAALAATPAPF